MDYSAVLLTFTLCWKLSSSIKCYRCNPELDVYNRQIPLCEHFDGSEKFVVDCEYSTVCFKKETSLKNLEDSSRSVTRGCALQTRDDEQVKVDGKWQYIKPIHEIYSEECKDMSSELGSTKTLTCYCRGNYCNGARAVVFSYSFWTLVLIRLGLILQ